ncbi:1,4-dihydroxy-2-naphthoate polyprenyltransferase [Devriesea agamarum]|uniref:1,4-dihydroxy-2-naphthoate polyprenyltransferase n=1 Tax=Devriesea agamarum TaxID=472569 RepID=UPI00071DAE80|nr:1,4-dihydroxy-2-naphthoate polyprenyltransferase [Devriesea agamarum]
MASPAQWISAARPKTLPAAVAPVAVGTALAIIEAGLKPSITIPRALLALGLCLALQIGVNYANDYSDGIRGTDDQRVGPFRLTGSGAARPAAVKRAAFICFAVGAICGLTLVALAGAWWMVLVGIAAIAAAWFYTGGTNPYGYRGLGEVFVFVFFGLVAVLGTSYLIAGTVSIGAVCAACAVGLLAVSLLVINNLRDIPTDRASGKLTLSVRIGDSASRRLIVALLLVPFALMIPVIISAPWVALVAGALPLTIAPLRDVLIRRLTGYDLIPALGSSGRLELVFSLLVLAGALLHRTLG